MLCICEVVQVWRQGEGSVPESRKAPVFIRFLLKKSEPMGQSHAVIGHTIYITLGQHFHTVCSVSKRLGVFLLGGVIFSIVMRYGEGWLTLGRHFFGKTSQNNQALTSMLLGACSSPARTVPLL